MAGRWSAAQSLDDRRRPRAATSRNARRGFHHTRRLSGRYGPSSTAILRSYGWRSGTGTDARYERLSRHDALSRADHWRRVMIRLRSVASYLSHCVTYISVLGPAGRGPVSWLVRNAQTVGLDPWHGVWQGGAARAGGLSGQRKQDQPTTEVEGEHCEHSYSATSPRHGGGGRRGGDAARRLDRKSTRLNSS